MKIPWNHVEAFVWLEPLLIKDTKAYFILLLGIIRLPKPELISEQATENILVTRHIANAMLTEVYLSHPAIDK